MTTNIFGTMVAICLATSLTLSHAFAQDDAPSIAQPNSAKNAPTVASPASVTLTASRGTMEGDPIDVDKVAMSCVFGEIAIPLERIVGIRFGVGTEPSSVALNNGDTITGTISMADIALATTWGTCKIHTHAISTITFQPGMAWTQNNGRWTLVPSSANTGIRNQNQSFNNGNFRRN